MSYSCKHFTKDWAESFGDEGNSIKGLAGENRLYHALCMIAKEEHLEEPKQLGEPDPVSTAILARTSGYPDCYLRVDDREYLLESRNVCYYHEPNGWKGSYGRPHEFFEETLAWVKAITERKGWLEDKYPVRDTQIRKGPWLGKSLMYRACGGVRFCSATMRLAYSKNNSLISS